MAICLLGAPAVAQSEQTTRGKPALSVRGKFIDQRIAEVWTGHPRYVEVPSTEDFLAKAAHALAHLRDFMPECCRVRNEARLRSLAVFQ
ncbi:MAG: hypothetical protein IBJ19_18390 [Gemmatimonadaceae bacterium]|nr:hypothetical protein [Gemmatimonadaceae bacterium]